MPVFHLFDYQRLARVYFYKLFAFDTPVVRLRPRLEISGFSRDVEDMRYALNDRDRQDDLAIAVFGI